ncbi:PAM68 family protein [Leptolyngbyaceae cyanobacterium UHCC 1019]
MSSKSWKTSNNKNKPEELAGLHQETNLASSPRLPFEPLQNRRKARQSGSQDPKSESTANSNKKTSLEKAKVKKQGGQTTVSSPANPSSIPEVVSRRMVRRIALFSGIPSSLGMLTFVISYVVVSQHYFKLPSVVVLLVSLGFFGLGVLGLSYGALSASWDEDRVGNWFGWGEFRTNFGRTIASWREARQKAS